MKNFVQAGENLTLAAPYALTSGDGALVGSIFGVATGDAENGAEVDLVTMGVFTLPKPETDVFTVGLEAFWDNTAKVVTTDDAESVNLKIGVAVAAAGNPSLTVDVRLNGAF
jgi:predicted RecA/RadA family phage recombinase